VSRANVYHIQLVILSTN